MTRAVPTLPPRRACERRIRPVPGTAERERPRHGSGERQRCFPEAQPPAQPCRTGRGRSCPPHKEKAAGHGGTVPPVRGGALPPHPTCPHCHPSAPGPGSAAAATSPLSLCHMTALGAPARKRFPRPPRPSGAARSRRCPPRGGRGGAAASPAGTASGHTALRVANAFPPAQSRLVEFLTL